MKRQGAVAMLLCAALGLPVWAEPLDQFGNPRDWKGSADAYTILDFAAAWCAPCWQSLPRLAAFAAEHPEFNVLVVSVDDDEAGRRELIDGLGLELPVLWDAEYEIAETFQPEGLPATVVLAPGGEEVARHIGSDSDGWVELLAYLEGL